MSLLAPIFLLSASFSIDPTKIYRTSLYDPIEQIVTEAIQEQQFPGCQVMVLHHGKAILNKAYGHLTYDSLTEVTTETLYDVASLTKVMATTLMVLELVDQKRIRLDDPISCYLEEYVGTNKEKITTRQLLAHNGQLKSYIPLWEKIFQSSFCEEVSRGAYLDISHPILQDSLKTWIRESDLGTFRGSSKYRYSDVGFMILQQIAERVADQQMDVFLEENIYQQMALKNTLFNPAQSGVDRRGIAPTELDLHFRYEQVWGEVHDRNAFLFGGVAGHAGLFSNGEDLAMLTNLFLSEGKFRGQQIFTDEVVEESLRPHFYRNRRGLGWDRKHSKVSSYASENSFGHMGFTGTMIWADPEYDLVFVFLSNRVYPDAANRKLISKNTRSRIQDVVYEALTPVHASHHQEVE